MNWNDIFTYINGEIFWKIRASNNVRIGGKAGTLHASGYLVVGYKGKSWKVHRIIWEMHNGPIPIGMSIDHIYHNRLDNRIENLRIVSSSQNSRNQSKYSTNSSGFTGVCWYKRTGKWAAYIKVSGKQIYLGMFTNIEDAVQARADANATNNFHKNHGK